MMGESLAPNTGQLTIQVRACGGRIVLVLAGEVDLANLGEIHSAVESALQTPLVDTIAMNMTDVSFLDSSGIGTLMACRRESAERDVRFLLTGASAPVRRILEMTGVWPVLTGTEGDGH